MPRPQLSRTPPALPAVKRKPVATPVFLQIYDVFGHPLIKGANMFLHAAGMGAFHAGVEINGTEWSFGFVEGRSGVFSYEPCSCQDHAHREALHLGSTQLSESEVDEIIAELSSQWHGESYDMLRRNCCHFAAQLCERLGVGPVPSWLNSLAGAGAALADRDVHRQLAERVEGFRRLLDDPVGVANKTMEVSLEEAEKHFEARLDGALLRWLDAPLHDNVEKHFEEHLESLMLWLDAPVHNSEKQEKTAWNSPLNHYVDDYKEALPQMSAVSCRVLPDVEISPSPEAIHPTPCPVFTKKIQMYSSRPQGDNGWTQTGVESDSIIDSKSPDNRSLSLGNAAVLATNSDLFKDADFCDMDEGDRPEVPGSCGVCRVSLCHVWS